MYSCSTSRVQGDGLTHIPDELTLLVINTKPVTLVTVMVTIAVSTTSSAAMRGSGVQQEGFHSPATGLSKGCAGGVRAPSTLCWQQPTRTAHTQPHILSSTLGRITTNASCGHCTHRR